MSTDPTDTTSTADDAPNESDSTESAPEIRISQEELDELGQLLSAFRDAILAHEMRLTVLEAKGVAPEVAKPRLIKPGE